MGDLSVGVKEFPRCCMRMGYSRDIIVKSMGYSDFHSKGELVSLHRDVPPEEGRGGQYVEIPCNNSCRLFLLCGTVFALSMESYEPVRHDRRAQPPGPREVPRTRILTLRLLLI